MQLRNINPIRPRAPSTHALQAKDSNMIDDWGSSGRSFSGNQGPDGKRGFDDYRDLADGRENLQAQEQRLLKNFLRSVPRPVGIIDCHKAVAVAYMRELIQAGLTSSPRVKAVKAFLDKADIADVVLVGTVIRLIAHKVGAGLMHREEAKLIFNSSPSSWRISLVDLKDYFQAVTTDPDLIDMTRRCLSASDGHCPLCRGVDATLKGEPLGVIWEPPEDEAWEVG